MSEEQGEQQREKQPAFGSFGEALHFYREHIADRIRGLLPGRVPDLQLTAKDVVSGMKEAGYFISQAAYSDIEQGQYLPKEPGSFLDAVAPCLGLEHGGPEYHNLMDHLLFDMVKQKLGPEAEAQYRGSIRAYRGWS